MRAGKAGSTKPEDPRASLKQGDHACGIFSTNAQYDDALVPFIKDGLKNNEQIICVVSDRTPAQLTKCLLKQGIKANAYAKKGQLKILTAEQTYLDGGSFDPDRMIAFVKHEMDAALRGGYSGFRGVGDMRWALQGAPGSERMLEYEAKLEAAVKASKRCAILCQYDAQRFPPAALLGAMDIHYLVFIGSELYENGCYLSPEEFLSPNRSSACLQRRIEVLKRMRELNAINGRVSGLEEEVRAQTAKVADLVEFTVRRELELQKFREQAK